MFFFATPSKHGVSKANNASFNLTLVNMRLKYCLSRFWLATSVSFYLFIPYLTRYTDKNTRFSFHWTRWDLGSLLFSIVLVGTLFFLCFVLLYVRGKIRTRKVFEISYIAIFGIVLVANIFHLGKFMIKNPPSYIIKLEFLVWFLLGIFILLAIFKHHKKIKALCITLCFISSPIVFLFTFNALRYQSFISDRGSPPALSKNEYQQLTDKRNVYIFIFDEWSYQRSFNNKGLITEFKNLKQFANQALAFHNAKSPWANTIRSISSFLFQTNLRFVMKENQMGFKGTQYHPINQIESIFHHTQELGFYTAMIGTAIPYGELLGGSSDFCEAISVYKRFGESFFDVAKYHLVTGLLLLPRPFFTNIRGKIAHYFFNRFQINRVNTTHELFEAIVQVQPRPTFAVFHYMIPHYPYIFNRDGHKKLFAIYQGNEVSNYYGNLAYLDRKIGEIITELKKANKFENSLIIMTSDHSWRKDTDYRKNKLVMEKRHVPLFIKMPYQKHSIEINSKFNTYKLGSFINKYLDGEFTLAEVKPLLDKENYFTPPPLESRTTKHLPLNKELKALGYISNGEQESLRPPAKGCKSMPYKNQ